jgi:sigma-B regulation protein RsbU (phosphoserine phosphatase)
MRLEFRKCINARNDSIPTLLNYVSENIGPLLKGEHTLADCLLAMDEAVTNIIMHAFPKSDTDKGGNHEIIEISIFLDNKKLKISIIDDGVKYHPENVPQPSIKENLDGTRKGGFGIFLIKKLMDNFEYTNRNGKNCLSITKFLKNQ